MNKFITIALAGLLVSLMVGCASTDPYYVPQKNEYGYGSTVSVPSEVEGVDILATTTRNAARVPQQETMRVSWNLTLFQRFSGFQQAPIRSNCEVLIKPEGSVNYVPYRCDRVEKDGRDFIVHFWFNENLTAINLATLPGNFVRNGFCESERWTPAGQLTARVVWQTHETVRRGNFFARAIGCQAG